MPIDSTNINNINFRAPKTPVSTPTPSVAPELPEQKEEKPRSALKLLGVLGAAAVAIGGTIYFVKKGKKPEIENKLFKLSDIEFDKETKNIAKLKGSEEKFSGTIQDSLKSGDKIEMIYKDGILCQSTKTSKSGDKIFTKTFKHENAKLTEVASDGKKITYTYEDNGKISKVVSDDNKIEFTYNDENKLSEMTKNGEKTTFNKTQDSTKTQGQENTQPAKGDSKTSETNGAVNGEDKGDIKKDTDSIGDKDGKSKETTQSIGDRIKNFFSRTGEEAKRSPKAEQAEAKTGAFITNEHKFDKKTASIVKDENGRLKKSVITIEEGAKSHTGEEITPGVITKEYTWSDDGKLEQIAETIEEKGNPFEAEPVVIWNRKSFYDTDLPLHKEANKANKIKAKISDYLDKNNGAYIDMETTQMARGYLAQNADLDAKMLDEIPTEALMDIINTPFDTLKVRMEKMMAQLGTYEKPQEKFAQICRDESKMLELKTYLTAKDVDLKAISKIFES